jgi:hypothetical protein
LPFKTFIIHHTSQLASPQKQEEMPQLHLKSILRSETIAAFLGWALMGLCFDDAKAQSNTVTVMRMPPKMQAVPLPGDVVSFQREGRELTAVHFSPTNKRVFLYPVRSTHSASLTRMGHPHDPWGHSHHNSIWLSHSDVDGISFWNDRGTATGRIVVDHVPPKSFDESDDYAAMKLVIRWISNDDDKTVLTEHRRMEVRPIDGDRSWFLIIDSMLTANGRSTTFRPSGFGLAAVRMAKPMGVHDGGGRILNSNGEINEKEVFRKPAKWCDYSGRVDSTPQGLGGITLMNHPSNPAHPTPFHVRDDGWMGACLNLESPIEVSSDKPLQVRYGFWIHDGIVKQDECEEKWNDFQKMPIFKFSFSR